jgi:hypothetical protein
MRLIAGAEASAHIVACPFCDCDLVHAVEVRVFPVQGCLEYAITCEGLQGVASEAASSQRGVSIVVTWACEWGHVWEADLTFHKGTTTLKNQLVSEAHTEKAMLAMPSIIWRD